MTEFAQSIEIERDADAVWEVVGDVARISDWLPFLSDSHLDGDVRVCRSRAVRSPSASSAVTTTLADTSTRSQTRRCRSSRSARLSRWPATTVERP
jgi:carbon monoxide dehydrogenase subunit G